ncbi:porin [Paraburkholderia edwinii]|uniref:Porin n=1 Tax=Paraburkholderia edwinii TaxID=2861782 RepID=A0ABX8UX14_9BURK|nr:porin [Paraburkholderia edwinii]QYD73545.1 porin [Paraburkholderia edwinii]
MKRFAGTGALIAAAGAAICATPACAQSSVTLYGIIDTGVVYQSSSTSLGSTSGGHSAVKLATGIWAGDRIGFKGNEDLGGGNHALFVLESGYNGTTGGAQFSGAMFGRQAFIGLANDKYGSLTLGRQYTPYYLLLSTYSPTTWLTGFFGAHPGDLDSLDTVFRANNTVMYTSPTLYGLKVSASYSLGGVPGSFNSGATWSAAALYQAGPAGIAVGFMRVNNSTPGGGPWGANSTLTSGGQVAISSATNGYATNAAQQRVAVTAGYNFTQNLDLSLSYSNVQYIPGIHSLFTDQATFNTEGAVLHLRVAPAWDFAAGYSYTRATKSNGISDNASYSQFNLSEYYALSKRTGIYALQAYQRANGKTLGTAGGSSIIAATASLGDGFNSTPASGRSMFAAGLAIIHRF